MTPRLVACTKCRTPLPPVLYNTRDLRACPSCRTKLQVEVFPAVLRPPGPGSAGEAVVMDGEATCFFHATKRAVVPCDSCGRFLCAVCDVEMNGEHLCSLCIESGKKKGRIRDAAREEWRRCNVITGGEGYYSRKVLASPCWESQICWASGY